MRSLCKVRVSFLYQTKQAFASREQYITAYEKGIAYKNFTRAL